MADKQKAERAENNKHQEHSVHSTSSGPSASEVPSGAREPLQEECEPSSCAGCPMGGSCGSSGEEPEEEPKTPEQLAEEYLAGWQRAKADYANLLKEIGVIRAELAKYACAGLITELLPVLDSLNKAVEHKPELPKGEAEKWAEGIEHTRSQFDSALRQAGVTAIDETGVAFDPEVHDAMMREAKEGVEPGTVLKVVEPGFRLHDRVIRAAKVIVAE